jgi:hypothetical protein
VAYGVFGREYREIRAGSYPISGEIECFGHKIKPNVGVCTKGAFFKNDFTIHDRPKYKLKYGQNGNS